MTEEKKKLYTNLIFLDIDGVLNHTLYRKQLVYTGAKSGSGMYLVDPDSIKILNALISETGAAIVISSTWRKYVDLDFIQKKFTDNGFIGDIIGCTPVIRCSYKNPINAEIISCHEAPRGFEIKQWIQDNSEIIDDSNFEYVILDDDSDILHWQRERFIYVDNYCGITINTAYKAARILTGVRR